jgi:hypothetical protein
MNVSSAEYQRRVKGRAFEMNRQIKVRLLMRRQEETKLTRAPEYGVGIAGIAGSNPAGGVDACLL